MGKVLTNHRDVPFEICFKYKLQNGYTFKELGESDTEEVLEAKYERSDEYQT